MAAYNMGHGGLARSVVKVQYQRLLEAVDAGSGAALGDGALRAQGLRAGDCDEQPPSFWHR